MIQELLSLQGRTALVTGATGELGGHFGQVLHEAGATVVLAARRKADTGGMERARAITMDVTDPASIAAAMDEAGPLDIVVNNAGIAVTRPFPEHSEQDWDSVVDVNLKGAFLVSREFAQRRIAAGGGGAIVNIASIVGSRMIGGVLSYAASKAGLLHMTRAMAVELARHRIRVNALAPGYIASSINAGFFDTEPGKAMIRRIPQRRLGQPQDLAIPLLLLVSEAGAGMTGSVITVDGGHSINSL